MTGIRINVGYGQTPTPDWRNFYNSLSIRLARLPFLPNFLKWFRLINQAQYQFIMFTKSNDIEYADAVKRLPFPDNSVEVIYSSHMLEHLDRREVAMFLREAWRILQPGGIIRIAVPDLQKLVYTYLKSVDADALVEGTQLIHPKPQGICQRLSLLFIGSRHHQWMYDGTSLCNLLSSLDFIDACVVPEGETNISNPWPLNLSERQSESVYVEAEKPNSI